MNNYKELTVWKYAISLAKDIFLLLKKFPKEERYSTVDQIKRCTISISSNIAEGSGRTSNKEFLYFLSVAYGSSCELDSLLTVCKEIEYINDDESKDLTSKVVRIQKMIRSLQSTINKSNPPN
jgi:four helix bundle protein